MADAFALIGPPEHSDGYWIGYLSTAIGEAADDIDNRNHVFACNILRRTLREFLDSPVPSSELRAGLRRYVK